MEVKKQNKYNLICTAFFNIIHIYKGTSIKQKNQRINNIHVQI